MKTKSLRIVSLTVTLAMLLTPFTVNVSATPVREQATPNTFVANVLPAWAQLAAVSAEEPPAPPSPRVAHPLKFDVSPPMRDMAPILPARATVESRPCLLLPKAQEWADTPQPVESGIVWDRLGPDVMPAPSASFDGVDNRTTLMPPDTQGDIGYDPATGIKYYYAWVNVWYAIYDVTDPANPAQVYPASGFANGNTPWQGFGGYCESTNDGDVISLYDPIAQRWLISQFALPFYPNGPFYQCIAVSQTGDPTGAWYRYAYEWEDEFGGDVMNDYPKFGVWPDAYYMTVNQFYGSSPHCSGNWCGAGAAAFERDAMLIGDPGARMVAFDLAGVNIGFGGMLPADLDGLTLPPSGAPGYFIEWDDGGGPLGAQDAVGLWEFDVDWVTPANSTFGVSGQPNFIVPTSNVNPNALNVPQPGTARTLDVIADRLMYRAAYRNFGSYEAIVSNRTNNVSGVAAPYWFEMRHSGAGSWTLYQEGEYAPGDGSHRWMGSIAQDHVGNMALGYSVASASVYPSVRYTGRLVGDPLGAMPQGEVALVAGGGSQTGGNRWGDYSMMGIDPVDDCTFWYTQEYYPASSSSHWYTRIGAFRFPSCSLGPTGVLEGVVTASGGGPAIEGATIQAAGRSPTHTGSAVSGAGGAYSMILPADTYTVTALAYGYAPAEIGGVGVASGATTTQDIQLTPAKLCVVEGTVSDALTGWPLYASIEVAPLGYPAATIWNDPITGYYSVTIPTAFSHTLTVNAWVPGYHEASAEVYLMGDAVQDLGLNADVTACTAPGYRVAGACAPQAGGLVVGHVYDANLGDPLVGAEVNNEDGYLAASQPTPDDPAVMDGFYALFSPPGARTFTATLAGYGPDAHSVTVVQSDTVGLESFYLSAGRLDYTPGALEDAVEWGLSSTLPLTLENLGGAPVYFEFSEIDQGIAPLGPARYVEVTIPGAEVTHGPDAKVAKRKFTYRPEISFTVEQVLAPTAVIRVLLLTPDSDTSLIETTLAAFGDLDVSKWTDVASGDPTGVDLAAYDVVIVGNDYRWNGGGMTPVGVGDALADYIDAGGRVIDTLFTHDWAGWELQGRYITEGYAPFTMSSADMTAVPYSLGAVYDPGHPILNDVTAIQDYPTTGIGHQNVELAPGAIRLADWSDGQIFVAYNDHVVGVNQLWYQGSNWSGDAPELMHNAILYSALVDLDWLAEDPLSGTLEIAGQQAVSVVLDAGAPSVTQPGVYRASLQLRNDAPYGQPGIPVTMTVVAPAGWGKIEGAVRSLGYCDGAPLPLAGVDVCVETRTGMTLTLATDSSGAYVHWLDEAASPLTLTVAYTGHETGLAPGVPITAQMTTTVNFDLRWLRPCVDVEPLSISAMLNLGMSTTLPMSIANTGPVSAAFELREEEGEFQPARLFSALAHDGDLFDAAPAGLSPISLRQYAERNVAYEGPIVDRPAAPRQSVLLDQSPGRSDGSFSDAGCDICGGGAQVLAENLALSAPQTIGQIVLWSGYFPGDTPTITDSITVIFHADAGGLPGAAISTETNAPYTRTQTGVILFGVHEWMHTLTLARPVALAPGTYWVEIYNDTGLGTDDFFWEVGNPDTVGNGLPGSAYALAVPGSGWSLNEATEWAIQLIAAPDVPWLSEEPVAGVLAAATGFEAISVTLDAARVDQPGEYYATLSVHSNDPLNGEIGLPVTMTVNAPAGWGKLTGAIGSLGYCDGAPAALEGTQVFIEDDAGMTWTLSAGGGGAYVYWLDQGAYTATASFTDHVPAMAVVSVTAQVTTTRDFDLRLLQPCIGAVPPAMEAALALGHSQAQTLTLTNEGAAPSSFQILNDVAWLSASPVTGVVSADGSFDVAITFTALPTLTLDVYTAALVLLTEDIVNPEIRVPVTLTIGAPPVCGFVSSSPDYLGQVTAFTNTTTGASPMTYRWDLGDGSPISAVEHPTHTYTLAGQYTVVLTAENPYGRGVCSGVVSIVLPPAASWGQEVYVNGAPTDTFPAIVFPGDVIALRDNVWITYTADVTFSLAEEWSTSLALTDVITSDGILTPGPHTLTWDVEGGAASTWHALTQTFLVTGAEWIFGAVTETLWVQDADPQPDVRVLIFRHGGVCWPVSIGSLVSDSPVTVGEEMHFTAAVSGDEPITYTWDFGGAGAVGGADDSPTFLYDAPGVYTVTLTVENGCPSTDTASIQVTVTPACVAATAVTLSITSTGAIYTDTLVHFSADIAPDGAAKPYTYTIDYGDGTAPVTASSSADPLPLHHTFAATGTYDVAIAVWNCRMAEAVTDTVQLVVSEQGVCVDLSSVAIAGAVTEAPGVYTFTTSYQPVYASLPITYTWDDGGAAATSVRTLGVGSHTLMVTAVNCISGRVTDTHRIVISSVEYDIYLPLVMRSYP